jgi:hypothetical protein
MAQYISLTSPLKLKVQYDETLSLELHEVESSKRSKVHETKMPVERKKPMQQMKHNKRTEEHTEELRVRQRTATEDNKRLSSEELTTNKRTQKNSE